MRKLTLTIAGSMIGAFSFGQGTTTLTSYWLRYYNQSQLANNLALHIEVDERRLVNPDRHSQFFSHVHLHKQFGGSWDFGLGFNFNLTNSINNPSLVIPEYRPWQEVSWTRKKPKVNFQTRYRLDNRFIHHSDNTALTQGYNFNLRHRFRAQWSIPFLQKRVNNLILKLSDEIMVNTGSAPRTFDQNRIFVSLEKQIRKTVSLEVGYLSLFQSKTGEGFYQRHIVRTTLFHRLTFSSKGESGD